MTGRKRAWLPAANDPATEFPLENLPYGVFSTGGGPRRQGVAIADHILDLTALEGGALDFGGALGAGSWNAFMARGPGDWARLRDALTRGLAEATGDARTLSPFLVPMDAAVLHMPLAVTEFTDFYSSLHHATNVGTMFRGADNALPPNWRHMPIGYNGRASSVVVSGTAIRRPSGQTRARDDPAPRFGPSARFDLELELGAVVGQPSDGPVTVAEADAMIFGYVLLNDWSARDLQAWEYQPLGPFLSKATATTISPWIVPAAALAPFRVDAPPREVPLLPYLQESGPMHHDIALEVALAPAGGAETVIARTNARELYFSPAQQLAHHASSGCPMRVGDLLGSGTISGAALDARGCLLEASWNGERPVPIAGGQRSFLCDGDTVTLRGAAQGRGYRVGFGPCTGTVQPATPATLA